MKKKFYVLLAIVGVNQILGLNSNRGGYNVALNEEEYAQIKEKTKGFGYSLTLSNIKKFREKSKLNVTIKQCYDNSKNMYKEKMESFNQKIIEFGKTLNSAFPAHSQRVKAVRQQLCNIVDSLKEYPDYLSKTLCNFLLVKKKMSKKSFEIEKYLEAFYVALLDIHKSGEIKASSFEFVISNITDEMKADCAKIVQQIKDCMGEDVYIE